MRSDHRRRRHVRLGALLLLLCLGARWLYLLRARPGEHPYPAGRSRPLIAVGRTASAHQASSPSSTRRGHAHKKARKPALHGDPLRAQLAFHAMQAYYYIPGSGLYAGEPFSTLWPFSQALAATVGMASVPGMKASFSQEIHTRLVGLRSYLDTNNSGASEGTFTSTLAAFDATVAPPPARAAPSSTTTTTGSESSLRACTS